MFNLKDFQLLLSSFILVLFGLMVHQSVTSEGINQHIIYVCIGLVAAFIISRLDLKITEAFKVHFYAASVFFLVLTLLVGVASRGSTRWLDIGFFRFQPSELAKPLLILSYAAALSKTNLSSIKRTLRIILIYSLPVLLIFIQPDFGTAIILFLIFAGMSIAAGMRIKHILILLLIFILSAPLLWVGLKDYQKNRVYTFLNPMSDPLGKGYNSIQSVIAVGSGQITGRGLGRGTQSKLRFLPEYHTDFVFASLAEELGFFGSVILIGIYGWFIFSLLSQAEASSSNYSYLAIMGIASMFAGQIIINIGMNIGLLPVTGITLPLVSSGGTSIVVSLVSVGIAVSLSDSKNKNT